MRFGADEWQSLYDEMYEARLQDDAKEIPMRQELNRAMAMMFCAGLKKNLSDAELLARDILLVAAELAGETGDPAFHIGDAARELERRIGDLKKNLSGYLAVLRVGAERKSA
jgi:hypothetical protein